jgi:hypothetical protein
MIQFPDHDAAPDEKAGKEWMLKAAKAISDDFSGGGHSMFANNGGKYDLVRLYMMNKQPINKYKTLFGIDEADDTSVMNVSWDPRGPGVKFRDLGLERILALEYMPVATPIDMESYEENMGLYAAMRAKLTMRDAIKAQNPEADLSQYPALQMAPGEPTDMEELEMRLEFGEQFSRSKDQELVVQLALYENEVMTIKRSMWAKDLYDWGVEVAEDGVGEHGRPTVEYVDPRRFICSYCVREDFSDMWYGGVLKDVDISPLANKLSPEEYETVKSMDFMGNHNPFAMNGTLYPALRTGAVGRNTGKVLVLDFEVLTIDTYHWSVGKSRYGNPQIKKVSKKGQATISKGVKMAYAGKWVVGTDIIYDYGPAQFVKRQYSDAKNMSKAKLRYKVRSYNFHEMTCSSFGERLMPLQDDYMMVMLNAQNVRNNIVPNGYAFDLDSLESVSMTWGGKNLDSKGIINLFKKKGILVYRGQSLSGMNPNGKAIEVMQNSVANEIAGLYNELGYIIQQMRDVTGMNELTDGSTPSDRMLNGVADIAVSSTNTALMPIIRTEREFLGSIAADVYIRVQQAIRKAGGFTGFLPAINGNTMKFVAADASLPYRDCAIMLEMMPTDEQKQLLLQNTQEERAQGLLDISDVITILNTKNMKQAQMMLAYKVKKNRETLEAQKAAREQATFKGQQNSSIVAEQAKQGTIEKEWQWRMAIEKEITARQLKLMKMKMNVPDEEAEEAEENTQEAAPPEMQWEE